MLIFDVDRMHANTKLIEMFVQKCLKIEPLLYLLWLELVTKDPPCVARPNWKYSIRYILYYLCWRVWYTAQHICS